MKPSCLHDDEVTRFLSEATARQFFRPMIPLISDVVRRMEDALEGARLSYQELDDHHADLFCLHEATQDYNLLHTALALGDTVWQVLEPLKAILRMWQFLGFEGKGNDFLADRFAGGMASLHVVYGEELFWPEHLVDYCETTLRGPLPEEPDDMEVSPPVSPPRTDSGLGGSQESPMIPTQQLKPIRCSSPDAVRPDWVCDLEWDPDFVSPPGE